jgi:AcrR family transcriptional regulator
MTMNPTDEAPTASRRSLRERRRDDTLDEIAGLAIELFDRRGFDDVTVEEIADAVGISARTFFRYFPSKDDILVHEFDRVHRRLVRAFLQRPDEEGAVTALRNAFVESSSVTDEGRHMALTYGRVQLQTAALNARLIGSQTLFSLQIIELVAARMQVDRASDVRPETITLAMSSVAAAMFRRWVADGGAGSPSSEIGEALDLLIDGLATVDASRRPTPRTSSSPRT